MRFQGKKKTKKKTKARSVRSASVEWRPSHAGDPGAEVVDRMGINLVALPGGGKTGAALSASRKWPTTLPAKKPVELDDIIHVGWDQTSLVGFRHLGIRVPFHFDMAKMMVDNGWSFFDVLKAIKDEAAEICARYEISAYIDDTMTSFDTFAVAELQKHHEGMQVYLNLKGHVVRYREAIMKMEGSPMPIACFHLADPPPEVFDKRDPKAKEKRKAKDYVVQGEGGALLVPQASKSIKTFFFGAASMEIVCRSYKGTSGKWQYELRTDSYKDTRAKNRFRGLVDGKENANIRALVDKLKKGMA